MGNRASKKKEGQVVSKQAVDREVVIVVLGAPAVGKTSLIDYYRSRRPQLVFFFFFFFFLSFLLSFYLFLFTQSKTKTKTKTKIKTKTKTNK